MRVGLFEYKFERDANGTLYVRVCGGRPVPVENETFSSAIEHTGSELISVNRNDAGNLYVKVETGKRAGKVWFLPKKAKTCSVTHGSDGLRVVYMIDNNRTDSMLLI